MIEKVCSIAIGFLGEIGPRSGAAAYREHVRARQACDGGSLQGRILRIISARATRFELASSQRNANSRCMNEHRFILPTTSRSRAMTAINIV
jgi:hypothetical protein